MPLPNDPLRIGNDELYGTNVESYLEQRREAKRMLEEFDANGGGVTKVLYASWFYLAIACGLGAFCAWAMFEPFFDDGPMRTGTDVLIAFLMFPAVSAMIGLFLGAAEGVMCRNPGRAILCGLTGAAIGFIGGCVASFAADILFYYTGRLAYMVDDDFIGPDGLPTIGIGFIVLMMGRAAAWSLAALPAGLGQGIALQNKKVAINGFVGGVLGGLFGGMFFDPLAMAFASNGQAPLSRMFGFVIIGVGVGLFVGLVESWTKTAWLQMRAGPLTGKQFIIFRESTVMGSSPKADIYLFKDPEVEPRHATLYNRGGRFEIEDMGTPAGTYVNGRPVKQRQSLQNGDQIQLGKTVLEFVIREQNS
jgi:hypothetical protein